MTAEIASDRQAYSSVEITKNTRGYSWVVKVYALAGDEQVALLKARVLDEQLCALYAAPEPKESTDDNN